MEHHIAELLYRSIRGKLSDFEREELNQWRSDSPMHEALFMRLQDDGYIDEELGIFVKGEEKNSVLWERIRENSILPLGCGSCFIIGGLCFFIYKERGTGSCSGCNSNDITGKS